MDTETTDLDPTKGELLEVAIVRELVNPKDPSRAEIVDTWVRKILPVHLETASPEALKVNGYTAEKWGDAVPFSTVAHDLATKLKDATWIGHNPTFDRGFLEAALLTAGVVPKLQRRLIDTTTVAYLAWGLDGDLHLSLDTLRTHLGISTEGAHGALKDAMDCREVFYRALENLYHTLDTPEEFKAQTSVTFNLSGGPYTVTVTPTKA